MPLESMRIFVCVINLTQGRRKNEKKEKRKRKTLTTGKSSYGLFKTKQREVRGKA